LRVSEGVRAARFLSLFALVIAWLMIFARLGELPLRDPDEGRNSEIAREMALNHSWLTPAYLGMPYLDKPAFFYKTVSLSMQAFGENETAARLPSALFATAILFMIYRFCRREYDSTTAALAVIIVAASPLFLALARHVIFDMTLAFFVCTAIFAGYFAETSEGVRRRNLYFLGAAASGFATLVKGPVGFSTSRINAPVGGSGSITRSISFFFSPSSCPGLSASPCNTRSFRATGCLKNRSIVLPQNRFAAPLRFTTTPLSFSAVYSPGACFFLKPFAPPGRPAPSGVAPTDS
jgi:hypothetical protein